MPAKLKIFFISLCSIYMKPVCIKNISPNSLNMRKKEREISDQEKIASIFREGTVCRIAIANDNIPYIVSMNYGYSGNPVSRLWFHCAVEGRKLDMLRRNNYVCFQIDCNHLLHKGEKACDFTMHYRSIVGYGHVTIVDDPEQKTVALDHIMDHYSPGRKYSYAEGVLGRTLTLVLDINTLSAKEL